MFLTSNAYASNGWTEVKLWNGSGSSFTYRQSDGDIVFEANCSDSEAQFCRLYKIPGVNDMADVGKNPGKIGLVPGGISWLFSYKIEETMNSFFCEDVENDHCLHNRWSGGDDYQNAHVWGNFMTLVTYADSRIDGDYYDHDLWIVKFYTHWHDNYNNPLTTTYHYEVRLD